MDTRYKNVVFDLDGTLVDSNPTSLYSLQQTIKIVENRFFSIKELEVVLGLSDYDAFNVLKVTKQEECYRVWKKLSKELDNQKLLFPQILNTLTQLNNFGVTLGIVTSREKERYYDNSIIMNDLNNFFELVVTSESTKKHKPNPEPLLKWLELSGAEPSQTIYIGDTEYDYICATKSNVNFGLAAWGLHQKVNTKLIFNSPNHILQLFHKGDFYYD